MINNKAFTLVELAIVIVIIGLLVGGVLQGQELIEQAKLRRVQSDINRITTAYYAFKAKYNAVPGDIRNAYSIFPSAGCTNQIPTWSDLSGCNGDGDGSITHVFNGTVETFRVWQHLNLARMYPADVTGTASASGNGSPDPDIGVNIPKAPWDDSGYIMYTQGNMVANPQYFDGNYIDMISLGKDTQDVYGSMYNGPLTPEQAENIDKKSDDGKPAFGKIRVRKDAYNPNCSTSDTADLSEYKLTFIKQACSLIFLIR